MWRLVCNKCHRFINIYFVLYLKKIFILIIVLFLKKKTLKGIPNFRNHFVILETTKIFLFYFSNCECPIQFAHILINLAIP